MNRLIESIRTRLNGKADHEAAIAAGYEPLDREQYRKFNRFRPEGPKRLFCYLPFNSLTFSFNGEVYVCSYNRDVQLGHYPENSISEIWNGQKAQRLREHMRHNDLSYGCRHCKFFFDKGGTWLRWKWGRSRSSYRPSDGRHSRSGAWRPAANCIPVSG